MYESGWWPTVPSHSILMRNDKSDNEYTFEYIKKDSVWYRVRYVDSATGVEIYGEKDQNTSSGVVSETAVHINEYVVDRITKSLVLVASEESNADAAKNEELSMNVITFYYTKSDTQTIFEVNHYAQDLGKNDLDNSGSYSLWQSESHNASVTDSIDIESYYSSLLKSLGYDVYKAEIGGKVYSGGSVDVDPDSSGGYLVVNIYYSRKYYPYAVKYIDKDTDEVLETLEFPLDPIADGDSLEKHILGNTVEWNAPDEFRKDGVIYDRISSADMSLDIRVEEDGSGNVVDMDKIKTNVLNIYYRERSTFTVKYAAVCIPKDSTYSDEILKDVKISKTQEVVSASRDITGAEVLAYPTDKCKFLGWFDNPDGDGAAISTVQRISRGDIGNIDSDKTYYAVFRPKGEVSTLRIEKYIDSLYYNSNDNPHGFADGGVMQPKNDYDEHGYLNMTRAEQSFVFRIEKYEKAADNNKGDLVGTSYTVMTFGADDEPLGAVKDRYGKSYRYMHSKDIMIEPGYIYTVTEVGISKEADVAAGLGWRYIFTGVTIPEMVSGTNRIAVVPTEPQVDVVYGDTLINAVQKIEFYAVRNNASNNTESDMSSITNKILIK